MNEAYIRSQSLRFAGLGASAFGFGCWVAGLDAWNTVIGMSLSSAMVGYGSAIGLAWYAVRADHSLTIATVDEPRPSVALPTAAPIRAARADAPMVAESNAGRFEVVVQNRMSSKMLAAFTEAIDSGRLDRDQISSYTLSKAVGLDKDNKELKQFLQQMKNGGRIVPNGKRWKLVSDLGNNPPHSPHPSPF